MRTILQHKQHVEQLATTSILLCSFLLISPLWLVSGQLVACAVYKGHAPVPSGDTPNPVFCEVAAAVHCTSALHWNT